MNLSSLTASQVKQGIVRVTADMQVLSFSDGVPDTVDTEDPT